MDATQGVGERCVVGVGDWPDVDATGSERGIGVTGEGNNLMLASIKNRGEYDGTEAARSSSDCDFDHIGYGK